MQDELPPLSDLPIVYVKWDDHTVIAHSDGSPWMTVEAALDAANIVSVEEVGWLLESNEKYIVVTSCLSEDEGTKGVSCILVNCITDWQCLKGDVPWPQTQE